MVLGAFCGVGGLAAELYGAGALGRSCATKAVTIRARPGELGHFGSLALGFEITGRDLK